MPGSLAAESSVSLRRRMFGRTEELATLIRFPDLSEELAASEEPSASPPPPGSSDSGVSVPYSESPADFSDHLEDFSDHPANSLPDEPAASTKPTNQASISTPSEPANIVERVLATPPSSPADSSSNQAPTPAPREYGASSSYEEQESGGIGGMVLILAGVLALLGLIAKFSTPKTKSPAANPIAQEGAPTEPKPNPAEGPNMAAVKPVIPEGGSASGTPSTSLSPKAPELADAANRVAKEPAYVADSRGERIPSRLAASGTQPNLASDRNAPAPRETNRPSSAYSYPTTNPATYWYPADFPPEGSFNSAPPTADRSSANPAASGATRGGATAGVARLEGVIQQPTLGARHERTGPGLH